MADHVENIILEHLRAIRTDIGSIKDDVRDIKQRLTSLEVAVAGLRRDNSNLYSDVVDPAEIDRDASTNATDGVNAPSGCDRTRLRYANQIYKAFNLIPLTFLNIDHQQGDMLKILCQLNQSINQSAMDATHESVGVVGAN